MSVRLVALVMVSSLGMSSAFAQSTTTNPTAVPSSGQGNTTVSGSSSSMTPSEKNAQAALEREGYTQIRDIKSGPEVTTAKAMKDGKEVSVTIDSSGKVKQ